tara:strand:+ start:622 stop:2010 length:1389 start_codon:yes stop_codon:yes gene_type:complete
MKLIGGNISDTPVKEIRDGSAFSAGGGAAADPAFLTLGTWGSATAISATGWTAVLKATVPSGSTVLGYAGGYVKLSATLLAYVWRDNASTYQMNAATIVLDSAGDFSSATTRQDISANFPDSRSNVLVRGIPGSSTGIVVYGCELVGTPARVRLAHYEISGATFSLQNSVIIRNCGTDSNSGLNSASLTILDSDYGCYGNHDTTGHARPKQTPFRFTDPQSTGTPVQCTSTLSGSWYTSQGSILDPNGTARKFYTIEPRMNSWTLSAGNPPTVAENDEQKSISYNNNATGHLGTMISGIITPPTSTLDGQMTFLAGGNHGDETPDANVLTNTSFGEGDDQSAESRSFGGAEDAAAKIWNHNTTFVPIDTDGDWHRGIRVGTNGTTGLHAWAQNVNVLTGRVLNGPVSATTNITAWDYNYRISTNWFAFDAFYDAAWSKDEIFILCEDTDAPPSYIKLPFTIT